jgi:hypothetical protein
MEAREGESTMHRGTFVALALLILAAPAAAAAQSWAAPRWETPRFQITPTAGYRLEGEIDAEDHDFFRDIDPELQVDEGPAYGVVVVIGLGATNWQLELLAKRQDSELVFDEGVLSPSETLGDVTLDYYHVGLAYEWRLGQVNPFVAIAGGVAHIDPEFAGLDADTRASGSLAGGMKLYFTDNVGLRLELRGYWTDIDVEVRDRFDRFDFEENAVLWQGEGSVGLIFAF